MQKLLTLLSAFTLIFMLNACNTMQGLGTDIKKGGEKLENSAASNKKN